MPRLVAATTPAATTAAMPEKMERVAKQATGELLARREEAPASAESDSSASPIGQGPALPGSGLGQPGSGSDPTSANADTPPLLPSHPPPQPGQQASAFGPNSQSSPPPTPNEACVQQAAELALWRAMPIHHGESAGWKGTRAPVGRERPWAPWPARQLELPRVQPGARAAAQRLVMKGEGGGPSEEDHGPVQLVVEVLLEPVRETAHEELAAAGRPPPGMSGAPEGWKEDAREAAYMRFQSATGIVFSVGKGRQHEPHEWDDPSPGGPGGGGDAAPKGRGKGTAGDAQGFKGCGRGTRGAAPSGKGGAKPVGGARGQASSLDAPAHERVVGQWVQLASASRQPPQAERQQLLPQQPPAASTQGEAWLAQRRGGPPGVHHGGLAAQGRWAGAACSSSLGPSAALAHPRAPSAVTVWPPSRAAAAWPPVAQGAAAQAVAQHLAAQAYQVSAAVAMAEEAMHRANSAARSAAIAAAAEMGARRFGAVPPPQPALPVPSASAIAAAELQCGTWSRGHKQPRQQGGAAAEYVGRLKSISTRRGSTSFGFIACEETRALYGRDVYVMLDQLPQGAKVADTLRFTVELSAKGHPRAAAVDAA
ncbi:unnamed protein product [Prorocentrum cordatum]|uniref:Uncharacterized protein n=1 Tax=Prorocentrum cordatum TaxID=2364126 RepID=A0ABN9VXF3_9DINO|nr:unnamed protein product [Polarella glacialis]